MPTTSVIFDIDGTLVDSFGFDETLYMASVRDLLGDVRMRTNWVDYEHVTDAGIALQICKDNGLETANSIQDLRTRFGENVTKYLRATGPCAAIPGALTLWNMLRDRADVQVGIATGGWGHTARMKLEYAGFDCTDVPLASSDDGHVRIAIMARCRALLPPTASTIYIGDGEWDQAAAEQLGWGFIGVGNRLRGKCSSWTPDFTSFDVRGLILA